MTPRFEGRPPRCERHRAGNCIAGCDANRDCPLFGPTPNAIPRSLAAIGWRRMVECSTASGGDADVLLLLPDGTERRGCFSWPTGSWRIWVEDIQRQDPPTERCGVVTEGAKGIMRVFQPLPAGVFPVAWKPLA